MPYFYLPILKSDSESEEDYVARLTETRGLIIERGIDKNIAQRAFDILSNPESRDFLHYQISKQQSDFPYQSVYELSGWFKTRFTVLSEPDRKSRYQELFDFLMIRENILHSEFHEMQAITAALLSVEGQNFLLDLLRLDETYLPSTSFHPAVRAYFKQYHPVENTRNPMAVHNTPGDHWFVTVFARHFGIFMQGREGLDLFLRDLGCSPHNGPSYAFTTRQLVRSDDPLAEKYHAAYMREYGHHILGFEKMPTHLATVEDAALQFKRDFFTHAEDWGIPESRLKADLLAFLIHFEKVSGRAFESVQSLLPSLSRRLPVVVPEPVVAVTPEKRGFLAGLRAGIACVGQFLGGLWPDKLTPAVLQDPRAASAPVTPAHSSPPQEYQKTL